MWKALSTNTTADSPCPNSKKELLEKIKMQQELNSFFAPVFTVKMGRGSGSFLIHRSLALDDW